MLMFTRIISVLVIHCWFTNHRIEWLNNLLFVVFRMFIGPNWAVFLGISHMVAVKRQLGLGPSEVSIDIGCPWRAQLGCQLGHRHADWSSMWLGLFIAL